MDLQLLQKRMEFIAIVQSAYLANGINMAAQDRTRDKYRSEYSGLAVKNEMCDAIRAAHLIPGDVDSVIAADDYVSWKLFAAREGTQETDAERPSWITPNFEGWDRQ